GVEGELVAGGQVEQLGGRPPGDADGQQPVAVGDEAHLPGLELVVSAGPAGGADAGPGPGPAQLHPGAPRRDLVGVDVQLVVAVAVDPQDLADECPVLLPGQGDDAGHELMDVDPGAEVVERHARAQVGGGRGEHVPPREGGAAGHGQLVVGVGQL